VGDDEPPPRAAVLFVVTRGDCLSFHPHDQACPVFARTLRQAR
jgi:DNA-binding sugar fermentation-stimulating protein